MKLFALIALGVQARLFGQREGVACGEDTCKENETCKENQVGHSPIQ